MRSPTPTVFSCSRRRNGRSSTKWPTRRPPPPRGTSSPDGAPSSTRSRRCPEGCRATRRPGADADGARGRRRAPVTRSVGGRVRPGAIRVGARSAQERTSPRGSSAAGLRHRDRAAEQLLRAGRRLHRLRGRRRHRALVRRGRPVPPACRVRDLDVTRHRVARVHARAAAGALRAVRAHPGNQPVPWPGCGAARLEQLLATPEADSLRAVELVKQHPGKMWLLSDDARTMTPLLDQSDLDVAWHAGQYQALRRSTFRTARSRSRGRASSRRPVP